VPILREHLGLSAVVSAGMYLWMCQYYGREPALGELLACEGIGIAAGVAADILEPATSPQHRALGHSVALGTALTKFAITNCSRENGNSEEFFKIAVAVAIVSYLAYLIADSLTPKGLPLLGRWG